MWPSDFHHLSEDCEFLRVVNSHNKVGLDETLASGDETQLGTLSAPPVIITELSAVGRQSKEHFSKKLLCHFSAVSICGKYVHIAMRSLKKKKILKFFILLK